MFIVDATRFVNVYYGTVPLIISIIDNDNDRAFLTEMYLQYRGLIYMTAIRFFKGDKEEVEDCVNTSIEKLCKYFNAFKAVDCDKRKAYIVKLVSNVCRSRQRELVDERIWFHDSTEIKTTLESIPDSSDTESIVFDQIYAIDLLNSFNDLSCKDKELIYMRHIDKMEFEQMAQEFHTSEGAVRTALSRAKHRLEKLATLNKEEVE